MVETISQEISTEALRNGDRAEFAKMVDAYSAPIYRLGLRLSLIHISEPTRPY